MNYRSLGNSRLNVSEICLGTMDFGTTLPADRSVAVMDAYFEKGGNFFDTANVYSWWAPGGKGGESEAVLGAWIRERKNRDRVVVATKLGFARPGDSAGLSAGQIACQCEQSLKRLRVDCIDLYYAHLDDRSVKQEESLMAFDTLVRQGKVRELGASNFAAWRLERARNASRTNGWAEYCCLQQRYSYLRLLAGTTFLPQVPVTDDILDYCRSEHFPLLAYTPLLGGCYVRDDRTLPPQYRGPDSEKRLVAVRQLARELGCSPNQLVLAWLLQNSPSVLPVLATGSLSHLEENLKATEMILTAAQLNFMNEAGACQEKNMVLIGP